MRQNMILDGRGRIVPHQYFDPVADAFVLMPMPVNTDLGALITLAGAVPGTLVSPDQTNMTWRGAQVALNIISITGTLPTVSVVIEGKDAASGAYYPLLTSATFAVSGFTQLSLYPGLSALANLVSVQALPRTWRIRVVIGGAGTLVTGTVGVSLIV